VKRKKIGLYIINYNYSDFLVWAMRSVQNQTRQPDVFIFVDDCSIDKSMQVFCVETERNKDYWKDPMVLTHKENVGAVKSMNEAADYLIKQGCDYVMGLSSDDVLHKDYIKECEKELKKAEKNVGWVYTWVRKFGDVNEIVAHEEYDSEKLFKYNLCHGSSLIKSDAWICVGGLPQLEIAEDWQMFKNMASKGWIGKLIAKPILLWRQHNLKSRTYCGQRGIKPDGINRKESVV
jgi:GT2 family glycosyltransferase